MNLDDKFPPILFNSLKHHFGYIQEWLEQTSWENIGIEIKKLGNSQMDLYYGKLSTKELSNEMIRWLEHHDLIQKYQFKEWLQVEAKGYQSIVVSDTSEWTIRWGTEENYYVHIHPARYTQHSMRIKATTLKTVLVVLKYLKLNIETECTLSLVNQLRKEVLDLSPIKSLEQSPQIITMIEKFKV